VRGLSKGFAFAVSAAAALAAAAPAGAAFTIGSDLSHTPTNYSGCLGNPAGTCTVMQTRIASQDIKSMVDGVITRVRARPGASATGSARLRVAHLASNGDYTFTAASAFFAAPGTNEIVTVPTRIPVAAGDLIGFEGTPGSNVGFYVDSAADSAAAYFEPSPPDNVPAAPTTGLTHSEFLMNADIELDMDHDGYGDETQDGCPQDSQIHGPCQADLSLTMTTGWSHMQTNGPVNYRLAIRNLGPDTGAGKVILTDALPAGVIPQSATPAVPGGSCSIGAQVLRCEFDAQFFSPQAGTDSTVDIVGRAGAPGTYTNTATIAFDNDPNPANNSASAPFTVDFLKGSCANAQNGTAANDTLTGGPAGDALHGLLGNDVLSALAGDDCLYGEAGNDTLDAGPGNDKLFGGPGDDKLDGGDGNDALAGDAGNDTLVGGAGNDQITGGAGNDTVKGGPGSDQVSGGAGADRIDVRDGKRDSVNCGSGKDRVKADKRDMLKRCEKVARR
jgi:uncharacterized repeat protein (TIGR01451 family)